MESRYRETSPIPSTQPLLVARFSPRDSTTTVSAGSKVTVTRCRAHQAEQNNQPHTAIALGSFPGQKDQRRQAADGKSP
jgi:hypothetical protein